MRASEFIRKFADLLDCAEKFSDDDNLEASDTVTDNTGVMVPPLQQNIELLKKVAGVESIYGNDEEKEPEDSDIQQLKHNAGIAAFISNDSNFLE